MSFASDKLYNGYLRRNMPRIVTKVKVREMMMHLPCLTPHDRENIEAKRETYGGLDSAMLLLDCLKRRENWVEQFIEALEACEQHALAAEIRAEYDALRGPNNSNSGSPPTTVIRAHVHPAPSATHLSVSESGANTQPAVAPPAEASPPPAEASPPPEPAPQASPPLDDPVQPQAPQSSAAEVPEAQVSPPEPPQPTPNEVTPPRPSTPPPPPSPVAPLTTTPPPQMNSHQEPEENSESDIQDVSGDDGVIPDQVNAANGEVSINCVDTPPPPPPPRPVETDTPPSPPLQTSATSTEVSPPQSPSLSTMDSDVTDGSSFLTLTPEKPPVQDTAPPVDLRPAAVQQPEETSEPPATQVVESSPQTETAAAASPLPVAVVTDASLCADSTVCLSKPGPLVSIHPENHESPTIPAAEQPYSGNSGRLEMSESASDAVTQLPACSAVSTAAESTPSALPCQENGFPHNEPEENSYESNCQSLEEQEVLMHEVHVSEEPSILDLDGQSSLPPAQIVNGDAAKEITSAPPLSTNTVETVNTLLSENHHPSEPADTSPDSEKKMTSRYLGTNTKYIVAAGVGACALLMAWRFKH